MINRERAALSFVLALGILMLNGAHAEGGSCPDGYYPIGGQGVSGCAPIPRYEQQASQPTGPQWVDRFGAVAWDTEAPYDKGLGISSKQPSRRKAEKAALSECVANGGTKKGCQIIKTYWNGCMAMAEGKSGLRSPHVADEDWQAAMSAVASCNANTTDCRIAHAACSHPMRIR